MAYVRFEPPKNDRKPPQITERPPRFGNIDEWLKAQNAKIKKQFNDSLDENGKTVMKAAETSIIGERKFRLMQQRDMENLSKDYRNERHLRRQQTSDTLDLLTLFEKPDIAKLVRDVVIALMGGHHVSIPCAGGGSVSSKTDWDGRKKNEEDENFRLRCWIHAAKTVKTSRCVPTKRKGYGIKKKRWHSYFNHIVLLLIIHVFYHRNHFEVVLIIFTNCSFNPKFLQYSLKMASKTAFSDKKVWSNHILCLSLHQQNPPRFS